MITTLSAHDELEHPESAEQAHGNLCGTVQPTASMRLLRALPLFAILCVSVAMSAHSLVANAASAEEGFNIYVGHQILYAVFHGGASPGYQEYLSGAPGIYPVLSAFTASLGGMVAARALSLACVLTATTLLYASVRRLFGYWPALSSSGLFAGLAISQFVASQATYDALALALVATAAFCTIRSCGSQASTAKWLLLIPVTLTAANVTAYYTLLFDPIIIALGASLISLNGHSSFAKRLLATSAATSVLLIAAFFVAGISYLKGVLVGLSDEQFFGSVATGSPRQIALHSAAWIGVIFALGSLGVLFAATSKRERRYCGVLVLLVAAGLLATAQGAVLHSPMALREHDDVSAWFAAIPAGYLLGRAAELTSRAWFRAALISVSACALAGLGVVSYSHASASATDQHPTLARIHVLDRYIRPTGHYLIANYPSIIYYLNPQPKWWQVVDDDISYPLPRKPGKYLSGAVGLRDAIRNHWFAVISFPPVNSSSLNYWERLELTQVTMTPGYFLVSTSGGLTFVDKYFYEPHTLSSPGRRGFHHA